MPPIRVFFDVEGPAEASPGTREKYGRIVAELFADEVPKTAENIRALATGEMGQSKISGAPLHYRGSKVHRVIKGFMIQMGELPGAAKGGESIYGGPLKDESFVRKHDDSFLLSMANRGPDTATSQFFITTRPTPHLDGKHVVVGRVVAGKDIVTRIEQTQTDAKDRPLDDIVIVHCGELELASRPVARKEAEPSKVAIATRKRSRSRSRSDSSASAADSDNDRKSASRSQSGSRSSRSRSRSRSRSPPKKSKRKSKSKRSDSDSGSDSDDSREERKRRKRERKERKKEEKRRKKEDKKRRKDAEAAAEEEKVKADEEARKRESAAKAARDDQPARRIVDVKGRVVKGRGLTRYRDFEGERMGEPSKRFFGARGCFFDLTMFRFSNLQDGCHVMSVISGVQEISGMGQEAAGPRLHLATDRGLK